MTTTTGDRRDGLLARLESIGGDLEEIAEGLPERDSQTCREELLTLLHRLSRTVSCMSVLAEETWAWVQSLPNAGELTRVDARAQENISRACRRLDEILTALRTGDGESAYWIARDVLDHTRSCGDYVLRLAGFEEEAAA